MVYGINWALLLIEYCGLIVIIANVFFYTTYSRKLKKADDLLRNIAERFSGQLTSQQKKYIYNTIRILNEQHHVALEFEVGQVDPMMHNPLVEGFDYAFSHTLTGQTALMGVIEIMDLVDRVMAVFLGFQLQSIMGMFIQASSNPLQTAISVFGMGFLFNIFFKIQKNMTMQVISRYKGTRTSDNIFYRTTADAYLGIPQQVP